ncbi:MAG: site-specific integrase [Thermoplasmata archaeon]|nr:site-specific integrase [Thermoplasmata archaeon]
MAGNVRTPESCMRAFLDAEFLNCKPYTRQKCEWSLNRTRRALEAAGYDPSPRKMGVEEVSYLLNEVWKDYEVSYRKEEFSYLQRYLLFFNNDTTKRMKVVFPPDMRVNADWLDDEQYDALMAVPKSPLQDIVIHLELCMGLRNVEVCRVMLSDIHNNRSSPYINVRGKGRGNGKYRSVRFHYLTQEVLDRWMRERETIVNTVRAHNPRWEDPGTLILWCHYKNKPTAGAYGEHTGALDDKVLDPLRKELGFHFANHTLRRTFGRRLFHAEVSVEIISKFLGHESTSETLKYIGVNLDDMDEGMARLAQYDRKYRPKRA